MNGRRVNDFVVQADHIDAVLLNLFLRARRDDAGKVELGTVQVVSDHPVAILSDRFFLALLNVGGFDRGSDSPGEFLAEGKLRQQNVERELFIHV